MFILSSWLEKSEKAPVRHGDHQPFHVPGMRIKLGPHQWQTRTLTAEAVGHPICILYIIHKILVFVNILFCYLLFCFFNIYFICKVNLFWQITRWLSNKHDTTIVSQNRTTVISACCNCLRLWRGMATLACLKRRLNSYQQFILVLIPTCLQFTIKWITIYSYY